MNKELNTDKIIREKLDGFSSAPPPHVWNNVQANMLAGKRKRRMAYIAWISAAAVVLLAFIGGWYFNESQKGKTATTLQTKSAIKENEPQEPLEKQEQITQSSKESDVKSEKSDEKQTKAVDAFSRKNLVAENRTSANTKPAEKQLAESRIIPENDNKNSDEQKITKSENSETQSNETINPSGNELPADDKSRPELSDFEKNIIAENVKQLDVKDQDRGNWKLGMNITPGYSSHVSGHSASYAQNMTYTGNNGNANVGGGVSVQYKTAKRWSVESGVYYAKNGQKSENSFDVFALSQNTDRAFNAVADSYFSNTVSVAKGTLEMNGTAGVVALNGTPMGAEVASEFDEIKMSAQNSLVTNGEFSQVFEFVEIPLLVRYRIIDSKFGLELMGGFNAGIVVGNNAYIDNDFGLQNVGKTEDISPVNVSGTLGLGLNYELSKHFSLGLEPRFNYYLSSINQNPDVDFRPYRIGFYTGIYYEF